MTTFHMAFLCEAGGLREGILRLCTFALRPSNCNFVKFHRPIAIRLQSLPITKTSVFSTIRIIYGTLSPLSIRKYRRSTPKQAHNPDQKAFFTRHTSKIVKNKTQRNYNLNTVNKTQHTKENKHQKPPDAPASIALLLTTILYARYTGTIRLSFIFVTRPERLCYTETSVDLIGENRQ